MIAKDIVGWIAFFAGSIMLLPQIIKIIKTKNTNDLSITMFSIAVINYALWITYGILLKSMQVYILNIICLISSLVILITGIVNQIKNKKKI